VWQSPNVPWGIVQAALGAFTIGWIFVFVFGLAIINIQAWHVCIGLPLLGWIVLIVCIVKGV
jgi:hypothetical protein